MSAHDNGGPAFPGANHHSERGHEWVESYEGMTLRDYFAAKAMAMFLRGSVIPLDADMGEVGMAFQHVARLSYMAAEAMIAERAK